MKEFDRTHHRGVAEEMAEMRRALTRTQTDQQRNQAQMLELVQRLHEEHFRALEQRFLEGAFYPGLGTTIPSSVNAPSSRDTSPEGKESTPEWGGSTAGAAPPRATSSSSTDGSRSVTPPFGHGKPPRRSAVVGNPGNR